MGVLRGMRGLSTIRSCFSGSSFGTGVAVGGWPMSRFEEFFRILLIVEVLRNLSNMAVQPWAGAAGVPRSLYRMSRAGIRHRERELSSGDHKRGRT
jgi:hypothetical protein